MSDFVVSARKYRPARFRDVVGQQHVTNTLKNAFKSGQLAHAFLFTGPRGVGKTTCARIMAMVLNCEQPTADWEACDECNACKAFRDNASFNIHELDAASNNSVEHIRTLIEQVRFQPQKGKYKIYIIDEVHMLSTAAFNAFLKTLEEPPPYAKFILATTEKHKILPTILSRCQIYDFNRIQVGDIQAHLQHICEEEKITATPDALHIIAQKADGGLRDALSIFDRMVSFCGNDITYEAVIDNLNILDYDYFFRLTEAMLAEDMTSVIVTLDEILRKGFDTAVFVSGLASHFRDLLLAKDPITLQLIEAGESIKSRYLAQAQPAQLSFLLTALNLCNECDVRLLQARDKKLHLQLYLIKMCFIGRSIRLAQEKKNELSEQKAPVKEPIAPKQLPNLPMAAAAPLVMSYTASKELLGVGASLNTQQLEAEAKAEIARKAIVVDNSHLLTLANVQQYWSAFAETVESPSFKLILQSQVDNLQLVGETILLTVSSTLAQKQIENDAELIAHLREALLCPMLRVRVDMARITNDVVEESKPTLQPPPPKNLDANDKLRIMATENPLVRDFYRKFDLRVD